MAMSMYEASVPVFIRMLNNLVELLKKGEVFAEDKGFEKKLLLNSRLAVDMFPLSRQIQIADDVTRRCIERLAGDELTSVEDDEETFAEFYDRINRTVTYLKSIKPSQIDGTEDKSISLEVRGMTLNFSGIDFLRHFSMPNVYFHVTTAYDILRHNGVELGKLDFLGRPSS